MVFNDIAQLGGQAMPEFKFNAALGLGSADAEQGQEGDGC
jgi:hypothetical protein